jgi:integrase
MSDFIGRLSFKSVFSDELNNFIAEKRGLGLKYEVGAHILSSFDAFVFSKGYNQKNLSKEIMDSWINLNPNQKSRTLWLKLLILRDFGRFMLRMGLPAYANFMLPKKAHDFSAYIFTDDELERLFRAADNLVPLSPKRHKHLVVPMLLRLLYYCGLRLSEATQLCVGDVDIPNGIIRIKKAKFDKERIVPMSAATTELCEEYVRKVHAGSPPGYPFFPHMRGGFYHKKVAYTVFRELLLQAGISHGGRGNGPRLHDLHHTYAVHCLRSWERGNADVTHMLPYLSAYLGHENLSETAQYLHLTADMFPDILEKLSMEFGDVIPEDGGFPYEDD